MKENEKMVLDSENAFEELRIAADNGDTEAQIRIAECYKNGQFCKKSIDKWHIYMKKAEANGSISARNELLTYYHDKVKNISGYISMLKSGRRQGDKNAAITLADVYANGKEGESVDLEYAYKIVKNLKDNDAEFDDPKQLAIIEKIEFRHETMTTRKNLILVFKIFIYAFAASLLLNFMSLFGVILMAMVIGPSIKWLIPWFESLVQKADNLTMAKIVAAIAGIISIPITLLTLFALRIIIAACLGV